VNAASYESEPIHHMLFTFYHMTTHDVIFLISLSLILVIYILMESSWISIIPYDITLLIVISHSTKFIPTHAKSFLLLSIG